MRIKICKKQLEENFSQKEFHSTDDGASQPILLLNHYFETLFTISSTKKNPIQLEQKSFPINKT